VVAITPDGHYVYVVNGNDGTVSVIDAAINTVTTTITVGGVPAGIAITPILRPTSKDQCKNGGWKAFGFKNQGQCIQFVNTRNEHDHGDNHNHNHNHGDSHNHRDNHNHGDK
jgi:YVTN family beta-propeller protein